GRRLSGKTVPAATRAAQRESVCIEHPLLGIKVCCQRLLSYYLLSASWAVPTSSQKLWVMLRLLVGVTSGALCGVARLRVDPSSDRLLPRQGTGAQVYPRLLNAF